MKRHGMNPCFECPVFSEFVPDFDSLEQLTLPSAHTVLFVAADATDLLVGDVSRVAQHLLSSGLVYVCVWGPDCQRVHDLFDECHLGDAESKPAFVFMSTWHENESLPEALEFFVKNAFPLDIELDTLSCVAVAVAETGWAAAIEQALSFAE